MYLFSHVKPIMIDPRIIILETRIMSTLDALLVRICSLIPYKAICLVNTADVQLFEAYDPFSMPFKYLFFRQFHEPSSLIVLNNANLLIQLKYVKNVYRGFCCNYIY